MADDFEDQVGYKKPPKANQFQKGRSGNPSGHPRRAPGLAELLPKILRQQILTHGKNGPKYMTKLEASLTQLINKAASGDPKAVKILTDLVLRFPEPVQPENMKAGETSEREKLLAALKRHEG
jgi:hypothetical protein